MTRTSEVHEAKPLGEDEESERETSAEAWRFVLGCWLIECLMWSFPLSFGVFQAHYAKNPLFASSSSLPTIGALCTGFSNFGFPFVSPICLRYPEYQRHILVIGWAGCVLSLVLASFATQVWQLMLFQGVMYGVSWPLCYTPFLLMCNEWFVKRRGTVYGIIYAASGLGGIVLPFVLEGLLGAYGFRVALRATAALVIVITGPGLWFVRPPKHADGAGPSEKGLGSFKFTKDKAFWIFALPVFVQALSFYQPRFFLPEYAHTIGLSHAQGATLLALYNIAQFSGQMGLGYLSDKVNIYIPVTLSTAVPALSALLLWGPAKSFSPLAFFAVLCGSFGAAYSVLWSRMSTSLTSDPATSTLIFGVFICERGVANMIAGPISELLTGTVVDISAYGLSKYAGVIIFVGVTSMLAALSGLGYFVPRRNNMKEDEAFEAAFEPLHQLESLESLLIDEEEGLKA